MLHIKSANSMDFLNSWSLHLTSTLPTSDATWPFVTIPNFERQGQDALEKTGARLLSICPIVSESNKIKWEKYSVENQDWIYETLGVPEQEVGISSVIFRPLFPRLNATVPLYEDNYLPIWQTAPIDGNQMMVNYDIFNYSVVPKVFETMMETRAPVLSETINAIPDAYGPPEAFVSVPIFESLLPKSNVVGLILALMQWQEYFVDLMPEGTPPMVAVVRNPCTESFSYRIIGPSVVYLGLGDFHDPAFAADEATTDLAVFQSVSGCENSVHIYPTQEFHDTCMTNRPMLYTSFAICLFLLTAGSFHLYDVMIQRRHKKIIKAATLSNALVTSLFPENVRSRIIREESKRRRAGNPETPSLEAKSNASIELPKGGKPIADLFPRATVLFADIAGFTAWSSSREPSQVFTLLESIYNSFDRIANKCRVFKVETIGDCYVAAAGLPDPRDDHAVIMARFAVLCMRRFRDVVMELEVMLGPDTADLGLRAGVSETTVGPFCFVGSIHCSILPLLVA